MPLEIAFYFISGLAVFYVLIAKRTFDLFTVAIICSLFYSYPLFVGEVFDPSVSQRVELLPRVYLVYSLIFFTLFLSAVVYDGVFKYERDELIDKYDLLNWASCLLAGLVMLLFLTTLALDLGPLLTEGKSAVGSIGPRYSFFVWGSLLLFSLSLHSQKMGLAVFSFFLITFSLYIGARSYFAAALLVTFVFYIGGVGKIRLGFQVRYMILGAGAFTFIFIYKLIYQKLGQGDYSEAIKSLSNWDLYLYRFMDGGEASLIIANLNNVVAQNPGMSGNAEHLTSIVFRIFPFLSEQAAKAFGLDISRFSDVLEQSFYSNVSFGMGSSFWGEALYSGGWILLLVSVVMFSMIVLIGSVYLNYSRSRVNAAFFSVPLIYCSFYIHRIEFAFVIYAFYISALYFLCCVLVPKFLFSVVKKRGLQCQS